MLFLAKKTIAEEFLSLPLFLALIFSSPIAQVTGKVSTNLTFNRLVSKFRTLLEDLSSVSHRFAQRIQGISKKAYFRFISYLFPVRLGNITLIPFLLYSVTGVLYTLLFRKVHRKEKYL